MCLLGVYAITVKLSAAMIILLIIIPVTELIKAKNWRKIIQYVLLGIVIVSPFLIRNVMISGYLIYPYPELDLFNVDWKMPKYTLLFDRNEINAWGWGLNDIYKYNASFSEWFPAWRGKMGSRRFIMFVVNIVLIIPSIIIGIYEAVKKRDLNFIVLATTMYACLFLRPRCIQKCLMM